MNLHNSSPQLSKSVIIPHVGIMLTFMNEWRDRGKAYTHTHTYIQREGGRGGERERNTILYIYTFPRCLYILPRCLTGNLNFLFAKHLLFPPIKEVHYSFWRLDEEPNANTFVSIQYYYSSFSPKMKAINLNSLVCYIDSGVFHWRQMKPTLTENSNSQA